MRPASSVSRRSSGRESLLLCRHLQILTADITCIRLRVYRNVVFSHKLRRVRFVCSTDNVRTPAALLVIPALNALWLDISSTTPRSKHPAAQTLYTLSVMVTVLLELVCVFVATVAGTNLLSGGFDPMSSDAVTPLVREFELQYLTTHLSFVIGLMAFMTSIGLRAWIQFGDTMDSRMAKAFTILTATFIFNMVTYFHNSVLRFHLGLPGLLVRFLVVCNKRPLPEPLSGPCILDPSP